MTSLPEGSVYENALLWPIGIFAKELTADQSFQRSSVLTRLQSLGRLFQMRHFRKVQGVLLDHWAVKDSAGALHADLKSAQEDAILLGE